MTPSSTPNPDPNPGNKKFRASVLQSNIWLHFFLQCLKKSLEYLYQIQFFRILKNKKKVEKESQKQGLNKSAALKKNNSTPLVLLHHLVSKTLFY
jgi:hypothetical protein